MSIFLGAIGAAVGLGSAIFGGISKSKSNSLQQQQLDLQRQQLELQRQSYYDNLTSSYYDYMNLIADAEASYTSMENSVNQGLEDIASNRYYLERWGAEYDSQMTSALSETKQAWMETAAGLGSTEAVAGATGRAGSVNLIARGQERAIRSLTGGSLGYSLNGQLGAYVNSTAQDALAEQITARSSINIQQEAIRSYKETMQSLQESILSLKKTSGEIKDTLAEQNRHV